MRITKPLNIGVLTRNFVQGGAFRLGVGACYFFDFNRPEEPLSEQEMWGVVPGELSPASIFDEGRPKAHGEVLLAGRCFSPGGEPVDACTAALELGPAEPDPRRVEAAGSPVQRGDLSAIKTVAVVGDRTWQRRRRGDGWQASAPALFSEMPLQPEQAFGGEGFVANPLGKGFIPPGGQPDPGGTSSLANLEQVGRPSAADPLAPAEVAGFFPLAQEHPVRMERFGTCDEAWARDIFPEDPRDTDPLYYNQAPPDQQVPRAWSGDELFVCHNMHPDKPRLEGRLPRVRTRCLVATKGSAGEIWQEVPMVVETVWLFPHLERGVVIHRGAASTHTFTGADVEHLVLAWELAGGAARPAEAYREAVQRRLDDKTALVAMVSQDDLGPPEVALQQEEAREQAGVQAAAAGVQAAPWPGDALMEQALAQARQDVAADLAEARDTVAPHGGDPEHIADQNNAQDLADNQEELAQLLPLMEDLGVNPELASVPPSQRVKLDSPPLLDLQMPPINGISDVGPAMAFMEGLQAKLDRLQPVADALGDKMEADADHQRQVDEEEARALAEEAGFDYDQLKVEARSSSAAIDPLIDLAEAKELSADYPDVLADLEKGAASMEAIRGDLELAQALAGGQSPALMPEIKEALHLVAHHTEPPGAPDEARAAALEQRAAALAGGAGDKLGAEEAADLEGANLAGLKLAGADLRGYILTGADLSGADLTGADLSGAIAAHADFSGAVLAGATLKGVNLGRAKLRDADLSGADLVQAQLSFADLTGAKLVGADLTRLELVQEAVFVEADLSGIKAKDLTFMECDLSGVKLCEADLTKTVFLKCSLAGADLSGATLATATLVEVKAAGCQAQGAKATKLATAMGGDFTNAAFNEADLTEANFRGALLQGADLSACLLDRADFTEARMEGALLEGASARGARFDSALMQEVVLARANLMGASLLAAALDRADLRGALLHDTFAAYATSEGALLEGAEITRCRLGQKGQGGAV